VVLTQRPSDHGTFYTAKILNYEDMDRQIVKSETCTVVIPEFELTIPPHKGQLTTVEGLLRDVVNDLSAGQPLRRVQDEAAYIKIRSIIDTLKDTINDEDEEYDEKKQKPEREKSEKLAKPLTIQLDDPLGNSFIEFLGSMSDPKWNLRTYNRNKEQNIALGLLSPDEATKTQETTAAKIPTDQALVDQIDAEEIFVFPGICSSCSRPLNTLMKKVSIPYFKVGYHILSAERVVTLSSRISSSCLLIARIVVIKITKLSLERPCLRKADVSLSKSRMQRISVVTSSRSVSFPNASTYT